MATRRGVEWGRWIASATLIAGGCGDNGGDSSTASASGASTTTGATEAPTTTTTTSGASNSETATAPTEGGQSISDSQATTASSSGATDSSASETATTASTGSTGPVDPSASTTEPGTTGDGTTAAVSESDGSSGSTSGDTTGGPPAICEAPPGFDGPKDPACAIAPKVGTFNPVVEWSKSTWAVQPAFNQVMAAPIVASLSDDNADGKVNQDDIPDIAFTTFSGGAYQAAGVLRVVSGKDGAELLNIVGQGIGGSAGVAAGDIDLDGVAEIVSVTTSGQIKAFEHTGELKWTSPGNLASIYACPAIADMDGDGKPEVIAGKAILNNDGTVRGMVGLGTGLLVSVVADIDNDGIQEYVGGNAAYGPNGATLWSNAKADGWVAIADMNLDAQPDIIVTGGGRARMQTNKGVVVWDVLLPGGGGGPPTIADYDGDGAPEVGVAGATFYVVLEADGKVLWQKATQDASSQSTGSSVFDFEGDGAAEAIYNDELRLRVYAGTNGAEKLNILGHGSGTLYEYPLVVDVDGDGQSEIVVINNNYAFGTKTGVAVIGDKDKSWRPTRKIWNQHAYSITNVNDDGSIPKDPTPNYKVYNSFRSGDLAPPDGTDTPDLTVKLAEPCALQCGEGKVVLYVHVGNEGASPLTAGATIKVDGTIKGQPASLATIDIADVIEAGKVSPGYPIELTEAVDIETVTVSVEAKEQECDTGNNTAMLAGPLCG